MSKALDGSTEAEQAAGTLPSPERMAVEAERPRWQKVTLGITYSVVLVAALFAGTFFGWMGGGEFGGVIQGVFNNAPPRQVFKQRDLTLLVLGEDETVIWRRGQGKTIAKGDQRTDTMMLVRLNFDQETISGFSIPRDMKVRYPGEGTHKINAYHQIGGQMLARQVVEREFGVSVDRVIKIDYEAFQDLINMVGGVELDVEKRMKYTDKAADLYIDLQPGPQVLDGYQAMGYARYRRDARGDFARTERQRKLLIALKDRILSKPRLLPKVVDQSLRILEGEFDGKELGALLKFAQGLQESDIRLGGLEGESRSEGRLGSVVIIGDEEKEEAMRQFGFRGPLPPLESDEEDEESTE